MRLCNSTNPTETGPTAIKPSGPFRFLVAIQLAAFDPHVLTNAIVVMPAMFATIVMTVDPMVAVLGPMARHPDHFPFTVPVTRTMAVIWPVTDFDAKPCRLRGGPESEARRDGREQQ